MATFRSAWLLGSVRDLPRQSFTVDGDDAVVAEGNYYISCLTDALSLCAQLQASIIAAGVVGAEVFLTQFRTVRITAPGAFPIVWGTATQLRDLLGFTGDLASATAHAATAVSPLLWSPGKPTNYELAPRNVGHIRLYLSYYAVSPSDGSTSVITHGTRSFAKFSWDYVDVLRVLTSFGVNGEWDVFFGEVLAKGASFKLVEDVLESTSVVTTEASLTPELGPYVYSPDRRAASWEYRRSSGFDWCDKRANISLPAHLVPEYDS